MDPVVIEHMIWIVEGHDGKNWKRYCVFNTGKKATDCIEAQDDPFSFRIVVDHVI